MADKMLRLAGRNEQGQARAVEMLGGGLKTSTRKNIFTTNLLQNVVINPGQVMEVPFSFNSSHSRLNLRLVNSRQHKLTIRHRATPSSLYVDVPETIIDFSKKRGSWGRRDYTPKSEHCLIEIKNLDNESLEITVLNITEFSNVGQPQKTNILRDYVDDTSLINATGTYFYYAIEAGLAGNNYPVDVRGMKNKMIKIWNKHSATLNIQIMAIKQADSDIASGSNRLFTIDEISLNEGEEKIWSIIDYPALSLPFEGLAVRTNIPKNITGTLDVSFLGGLS